MRMVFDTNVLINAFNDDYSYPARLIEAATKQELTAVITQAVEREYRKILRRLIDDPDYQERISRFLANAEQVEPGFTDVQIDDVDDRKFIQAALGGRAALIVSNDRHLLDIGEVDGIHMVTPTEAWTQFDEAQGGAGEWGEWAKNLGLS